LTAPMLVVNGAKDKYVPSPWIAAAVAHSCQLGGRIKHVVMPDAGHSDVGFSEMTNAWLTDRFSGKPAPSDCAASEDTTDHR